MYIMPPPVMLKARVVASCRILVETVLWCITVSRVLNVTWLICASVVVDGDKLKMNIEELLC